MKKILILAVVLGMTPILTGCPANETKKADAPPAAEPASPPADTPPAEPEKNP